MVDIIQADRNLAADIWQDLVAKPGECIVERQLRSGGKDECSLVQGIKDHRLAHSKPASEGLRACPVCGGNDPKCRWKYNPADCTKCSREHSRDTLIKHMTERFLAWKLPADFAPDCGITFKAEFNGSTGAPMRHEPVGTNLLTYTQAKAMIRHLLEGAPEFKQGNGIAARCVVIARTVRDNFLSPQYATGQPMSSFSERLACDQVADAITKEFALQPLTEPQRLGQEGEAWERCGIGSCKRHQECMYTPCRTAALTPAQAEPVAFISAGQLEAITDRDDDGGTYLPVRKAARGNFRTPLFAHPPAPPQPEYGRIHTDGSRSGGQPPQDREAFEDRLEDALTTEIDDVEIEDALVSEGIHVWGPDGERFQRMFAVVMKLRRKRIERAQALADLAEGDADLIGDT